MDDSDFQAKLTQMRASMDSTFGGMSGGMGGMSAANMMANMNAFQSPGYSAGWGGQLSAFGYTPVPMAMTPNMGQISMQQSFSGAMSGALTGSPFLGAPPASMTIADYMAYSQRSVADSFARGASVAATAALSTGVGIGAGALGTVFGSAMFGAQFGGPIGMIAGGMLGAAAVSPIGAAVADNFRIQEHLANTSFRYMTGSDRDMLTGRGFSRQARADIANFAIDLERNDFRVNMADVENIMVKGTNAGLFEGTRDVEDFKEKFRGLVDKVKRITATLNTTASEGIEVIRAYKDMGITSTQDVIGMSMASDAMGIASGRTGMEMTAIGMQGANIFRGTGISMKTGFQLNQMNATRAQLAYTSGVISADELAQAGGVEGMSQTMTANALAGMQTGVGRLLAVSMYDPKTMSLNASMASADINQTTRRAAATFRDPIDVLKYELHQTEILNKFGKEFGGMGTEFLDTMTTAQYMSTGQQIGLTDVEDQVRFAMHGRGIKSEAVIKEQIERFKNPSGIQAQMQASISRAISKQSMEDFRDKSVLMNFKEATMDAVARFFDPIPRAISAAGVGVGTAAEYSLMSLSKGDVIFGGHDDVSDYAMSRSPKAVDGVSKIDTTGIFSGERFVQGNPDRLARNLAGKITEEAETSEGQTISIGNQSVRVFRSETSLDRYTSGKTGVAIRAKVDGKEAFIFSDREADIQGKELDKKFQVTRDMLDKAKSSTTSRERDFAADLESADSNSFIKNLAVSGALGQEDKDAVLKNTDPKVDYKTVISKAGLAKAAALATNSTSPGARQVTEATSGAYDNLNNAELAVKSKEADKVRDKYIGALGYEVWDNSIHHIGKDTSVELHKIFTENPAAIKAAGDFLLSGGEKKGDLIGVLKGLNISDEDIKQTQASLTKNSAKLLPLLNEYTKTKGATIEQRKRDLKESMSNVDISDAELTELAKAGDKSGATGYAATSKTGDKTGDALANFQKMSKILDTVIFRIAKNAPFLLQ